MALHGDPENAGELAGRLGLGMSHRSREIFERVVKPGLIEAGVPEDDAEAYAHAFDALWRRADASDGKSAPLVVGEQECKAIVEAAVAMREADIKPDGIRDLFEKVTALRNAPETVQEAIKALRAMVSHAGLDGALFGRFATGVAVRNIDSAVHVAHALTVHPIQSVSDYFVAQDTLQPEEEHGAAHMDYAELASGLFYNYAVVDLRQLNQNFADLSGERRAEIAAWIVHAFATVEPAAKRGSTAPYSGLRDAIVEIGRRQPRSLMGAFERAVDAVAGRAISEVARENLTEHLTEMDGLIGKPDWRGRLRDYVGGDVPAIEALADAMRKELANQAQPVAAE